MRNLDICRQCRCFDAYYEGDDRRMICMLDILQEKRTKTGLKVVSFKEAKIDDTATWRKYDVPLKCPFYVEQCMESWN